MIGYVVNKLLWPFHVNEIQFEWITTESMLLESASTNAAFNWQHQHKTYYYFSLSRFILLIHSIIYKYHVSLS